MKNLDAFVKFNTQIKLTGLIELFILLFITKWFLLFSDAYQMILLTSCKNS